MSAIFEVPVRIFVFSLSLSSRKIIYGNIYTCQNTIFLFQLQQKYLFSNLISADID